MFVHVKDAATAFKTLSGIFCVYKPSCMSVTFVRNTLKVILCRDLNGHDGVPIGKRVVIEGPTNAPMQVKLVTNYADMPAVSGPRYLDQDIKISFGGNLGLFSSGVLIAGVNEGAKIVGQMRKAKSIRVFKIHGELGKATDTFFWHGRTTERTHYTHVTREKIDTIVASMQAAHQKAMYEMSGLHMDSEDMYDMATKGLIRPKNGELPVLYGIKCVYFKPPEFTLEIQGVNVYDQYLWSLIHDLGVQLKSSAHCTAVQCIREGKFTTEHALLRKYWNLSDILENMSMCNQIVTKNPQLLQDATLFSQSIK